MRAGNQNEARLFCFLSKSAAHVRKFFLGYVLQKQRSVSTPLHAIHPPLPHTERPPPPKMAARTYATRPMSLLRNVRSRSAHAQNARTHDEKKTSVFPKSLKNEVSLALLVSDTTRLRPANQDVESLARANVHAPRSSAPQCVIARAHP